MNRLEAKISTALSAECKLTEEAQVHDYVVNRIRDILNNHVDHVCKIYEPGEGGQNYYMTKLTPKDRNHAGKIYAKTRQDLENQIIAFYLQIQADEKVTVRDILIEELGGSEEAFSKTSKRTFQRFNKNMSELGDLKIGDLSEKSIREALDRFISQKPTEKEFNATITALNKIAIHCDYEHINVVDIRKIVSTYREHKLTGKHIFRPTKKQTRDLAFKRKEAAKIVHHALENPSYKSLAVALLITLGLRAGELLGLELDKIHLKEGYVWIDQTEDTKSYQILPYVKQNEPREVYFSDEALIVLKACLDFRNKDKSNSPYLFLNPNSDDGKMHLRAIDDYMRTTIHKDVLGYGKEREARSPHDCRRTYASLEYLNGTPINAIREQLGHENVAQTWDYIKNVVESSERRSQLKGGGLFLKDPNPQKPRKHVVDAVWTQKSAK